MANPPKSIREIIESLRVGISAIETGGHKDPYSATAGDKNKDGKPDSTALGRYQFLKTYWWDSKHPIPGIKHFAKGKEAVFGEIKEWEDVKGNKELQDAYFDYYAENHLIPEAKKALAKDNPLNLSLGRAVAIMHKNGYIGGKNIITTGKLIAETDTNTSDNTYLKVFDKAISNAGYSDVSINDYLSIKKEDELDSIDKKLEKKQKETVNDFIKKDKKLNDLAKEGISQKAIETARAKIFQEVKSAGLTNEFDEYIEEERTKVEAQKEFMGILIDSETEMFDNEGIDNDSLKQITGAWGSTEKMNHLKETLPPELSKYIHVQSKEGESRIVINRLSSPSGGREKKSIEKFITALNESNQEIFGENYTPIKNKQLKENWTDNIGATLKASIRNIGKKLDGNVPIMPGSIDAGDTTALLNKQARPKIDWNKVATTPAKEPEIVKTESTDKKAIEEETTKETPKDEVNKIGAAQEAFNTELGLLSTGDGKTVPLEGKRELPIDAITGMALGLIGNEQAKNANIPLRTEEVSQAVKQFTADLAKSSKEGLPAEVEAAMNNKLAEAYQGGLRSIVNASAGNRATVLGNQGQLEVAKNRGLVDISLADFEAKEKAFQQYGEAIKYKNDFDARRDIANHSIRYQEGKRDQRLGTELATAGFKQLVDGIKYQKENGPGSANSLYKAHLFQKMFGFNPNAPDDGTGKPGTRSAWEMKKKEKEEKESTAKVYQAKLNSMNPNQRKAADKFYETNTDTRNRYQFLDYLEENPNIDPEKIKMDNMDLATKQKDYGLLSIDRKEIEKPKMISQPDINKTAVNDFFIKPKAPIEASNTTEGLLATAPKSNSPEELLNNKEKAPNFAEDYESRVLENLTNLV